MWRYKIAVMAVALLSHPIVLFNIRGQLGWREVREIAFVPILGWPLVFLYYSIILKSRVSIVLCSCIILVAYPVAISLVARDTSSTAAIGYLSIPWGLIFPSLVAVHILDSLGKYLLSSHRRRQLQRHQL